MFCMTGGLQEPLKGVSIYDSFRINRGWALPVAGAGTIPREFLFAQRANQPDAGQTVRRLVPQCTTSLHRPN
jgi:hypothetical protein